jgi:hypothetical protein
MKQLFQGRVGWGAYKFAEEESQCSTQYFSTYFGPVVAYARLQNKYCPSGGGWAHEIPLIANLVRLQFEKIQTIIAKQKS